MDMKKRSVTMLAAMLMLSAVGFVGCGEKTPENEVFVYMPDGAPAMAFAKMMEEDKEDDGVTYRVVNPTVIASKVTNADAVKNADICALPVTAASKLLGKREDYQALGVLTSGNLCLLSKDEGLIAALKAGEAAKDGYMDALKGKVVGVMKINDMPGLTWKSILDDYGMPWQEVKNDGEIAADKVNLKAITDATAIDPSDKTVSCYLVAEPATSVQVKKKGFSYVGSIEEMYYHGAIPENCTEESYTGYPQAVLVAKKSLIKGNEKWLHDFMTQVKDSSQVLQTDWATGEKIVASIKSHLEDPAYATTLNATVLTKETIGRCRAYFSESALSKDAVQTYLNRISVLQSSVSPFSEGFFYTAWKSEK